MPNSLRHLLAIAALTLLVAVALLVYRSEIPDTASGILASSVNAAAQIERGEYLALAGNCASCHTAANGESMAGGLAFETPFGRIYSTNITPDAETGIGDWTGEQFLNSMRRGVRPNGYNDGPREQFAALYPDYEQMTVEETQLKQEIETWHLTPDPDSFVFHEAQGPYSWGLNLDGETGPNDFTHPDGEEGIDNEVYRAVGCIIGFRGPDGVEVIFQDKAITDRRYNRTMIELTGVDNLTNDHHVTVTVYRGLDRLLTDATGSKAMPGGSQRVDTRWGAKLIRQTEGKIVDSVLTTEPIAEAVIPWMNLNVPTFQIFRDMVFQLKLTPTGAEGLIAGYADVDTWYTQLIRNDSTHHLSNGQISGVSLYKALRRLADAYPDPETGANAAISTALDVKLTQVYIVHPSADAIDTAAATH